MAATKAQKRAYYHRHKERINKERSEKMRGKHPSRAGRDRRLTSATYRAAKLKATPYWSDADEIALIYKQAGSLQKLLDRPLHVDHIIPLRGKLVSGLHVPDNLQITDADYNIRKSNSF